MKQVRYIFCLIFVLSLAVQLYLRKHYAFLDTSMWADQIKYFLNQDKRVFDFYAAYGHPGGTLIELGIIFKYLIGVSYDNAIIISISTIVAATTAACSAVCLELNRWSYWWLTTAIMLTCNRLSLYSTPPTEAVMPFMVLVVLLTWLLIEREHTNSVRLFFIIGCILGLSAATRLDVTILVGMPMIVLVWYKHGRKALIYSSVGVVISFLIADPFMWFMPVQHLRDLVQKFTIHHNQFTIHQTIKMTNLLHASPLALVSIIWSCILVFQRRICAILPINLIVLYFMISLLGVLVVMSSSFQSVRYLYPLIIVWEILLPLLAFHEFSNNDCSKSYLKRCSSHTSSKIIVCLVVVSVFFSSRIGFDIIAAILNYFFDLDIVFDFPFDS